MVSYATIEDWLVVEDGSIVDMSIRQTEDEQDPCVWDVSLHFGEIGDRTILRYDNA